jgi:glutamyl-Q tRNA(Asp) synthetase
MANYIGRFAPSPTGPLHAGSLVAALASWLDAKAHQGQWLVRVEDIDSSRCRPAFTPQILAQLAAHGMTSDAVPVVQSDRHALYDVALQRLRQHSLVYPCQCSRKQIEAVLQAQHRSPSRHLDIVYPGTCKVTPPQSHSPMALRLDLAACDAYQAPAPSSSQELVWYDRRLGKQKQNLATEVGDFVLKRADGIFAYQLAVVVDDALQGVTHIVRGQDLADNTARQITLQRVLGYATPHYLHTPLVLAQDGDKLSKQNGAQALDIQQPMRNLTEAAQTLGLVPKQQPSAHGQPKASAAPLEDPSIDSFLAALVEKWRHLWVSPRPLTAQ